MTGEQEQFNNSVNSINHSTTARKKSQKNKKFKFKFKLIELNSISPFLVLSSKVLIPSVKGGSIWMLFWVQWHSIEQENMLFTQSLTHSVTKLKLPSKSFYSTIHFNNWIFLFLTSCTSFASFQYILFLYFIMNYIIRVSILFFL